MSFISRTAHAEASESRARRIAVAGLNPHAGENGLFGREELDEIIPAIRAAQDEGLCVDGPCAAGQFVSQGAGRLV